MVPNVMLGGYLLFWAALGLAPLDPGNWVLASILPLTFVGALLFGRRALPLSAVSYALIAGFLALHTVGAHYTYAEVPLGHWLQTMFGLERNDFDRVVHFAFGLCLTFPLLAQILAYPYGREDDDVVKKAKEYGYIAAFTVRRQGSPAFVFPLRGHRSQIYSEMTLEDFVKNINVFATEELK